MVTLRREGDGLVVDVQGVHRLLALKGALRVPIASIRHVGRETVSMGSLWRGLRLPGTHIPGVLVAGSYYKSGEWHFWDVRDPASAIEIQAEGGRYRRIVVEVEDPDGAVDFVRALMRTQRPPPA